MLAWEQHSGAVPPACEDVALVFVDGLFELVVDRDGGFPFHLGVEIPQIGGVLAVVNRPGFRAHSLS